MLYSQDCMQHKFSTHPNLPDVQLSKKTLIMVSSAWVSFHHCRLLLLAAGHRSGTVMAPGSLTPSSKQQNKRRITEEEEEEAQKNSRRSAKSQKKERRITEEEAPNHRKEEPNHRRWIAKSQTEKQKSIQNEWIWIRESYGSLASSS